jgi:hypothetical protein
LNGNDKSASIRAQYKQNILSFNGGEKMKPVSKFALIGFVLATALLAVNLTEASTDDHVVTADCSWAALPCMVGAPTGWDGLARAGVR